MNYGTQVSTVHTDALGYTKNTREHRFQTDNRMRHVIDQSRCLVSKNARIFFWCLLMSTMQGIITVCMKTREMKKGCSFMKGVTVWAKEKWVCTTGPEPSIIHTRRSLVLWRKPGSKPAFLHIAGVLSQGLSDWFIYVPLMKTESLISVCFVKHQLWGVCIGGGFFFQENWHVS